MPRRARKLKKVYASRLVVEGMGRFPIDMLRHDCCVPEGSADASAIERGRDDPAPRRVTLLRFSASSQPTTAGRWASFGWRVLSEEPTA